jgi:hypothetical protein
MIVGISDGWQMVVQQKFAVDIYEQMWGGCRVHENDAHAKDGNTAELLDFGDVDKIIVHEDSRQVHMAQRFRKPYGPNNTDPDFTLRYSRPYSDETIEHERLMTAFESDCANYPSRYAFGRVHTDHSSGIYELFIIDTDKLIKGIKNHLIAEHGPRENGEGQKFMWYDIDQIRRYGAVCNHWQSNSDTGGQTGLFQYGSDE